MKVKTSITLSPEALRLADELAGDHSSRSGVVEQAIFALAAQVRRHRRDARDLAIYEDAADELNAEIEDVLDYQGEPVP